MEGSLAYSFALRSQAEQALQDLKGAGVDPSRASFLTAEETGLTEAVLEDTRFFARDRRFWLTPKQAVLLGGAMGVGSVLAAGTGVLPPGVVLVVLAIGGALLAWVFRGRPADQERMAGLFLRRGDLVVLVQPRSPEERQQAVAILEACGGHPRESPP